MSSKKVSAIVKQAVKAIPSQQSAKAKKPEPKKPVTTPKEKVKKMLTRTRELVLEKKYSDEEIVEIIRKEYPGRADHKYRGAPGWERRRWNKANPKETAIQRLYRIDGKLIPKDKLPPKQKTTKKIDPAKDPLNTIAGGLGIEEKKPAPKPIKKTVPHVQK